MISWTAIPAGIPNSLHRLAPTTVGCAANDLPLEKAIRLVKIYLDASDHVVLMPKVQAPDHALGIETGVEKVSAAATDDIGSSL
mmetsp:Transcript_36783/g.97207  ORF Transcript_36783/g.97207 Transcript_36783/m.97207 type:complete len:84 (-) Transcript_36783:452-703(-)